jgi:hypothetical protein
MAIATVEFPPGRAARHEVCSYAPGLINSDRLELVSAPAASTLVVRLLRRLDRGDVLDPLELPETAWLVLAIVVLELPITRAEIASRRLADSDRQVHALLCASA